MPASQGRFAPRPGVALAIEQPAYGHVQIVKGDRAQPPQGHHT